MGSIACSPDDERPDIARPGSSEAATTTSVRPLGIDEVEAVILLPDQRALLATVEDQIAGDCMRASGFEYRPMQLEAAQQSVLGSDLAFQQNFPYTDLSEPYRPADPEVLDRSNEDYYGGLTQSEQERYTVAIAGSWEEVVEVEINGGPVSTSSTGCISDARRALYGDIGDALIGQFFTNNLRSLALGATTANEEVVSNVQFWRDCMAANGFQFSEFAEARSFVYENQTMVDAVSGADASCVNETGIGQVFNSVYQAELSKVVEANAGYLEKVATVNALALANAQSYLASI